MSSINTSDALKFMTIPLEQYRLAVSSQFGQSALEILADAEFRTWVEQDVMGNMMLELVRECLAYQHEIKPTEVSEWVELVLEERVPATWWQHFKLSAIRDGNPFFNPKKVKYRTIRKKSRQRVEVVFDVLTAFPEWPFKVPKDAGRPYWYSRPNTIVTVEK